ncbi:MAG: hypothetical protein KTR29_09685 [Rhodothermaceae bacterium]|nr:hypothetical protein [Rhodothermaceae bacterium]
MNHSSGRQPKGVDKAGPPYLSDNRVLDQKRHFKPARVIKPDKDPELDQLNLIIDAALSLDPSKRSAFVQRSCGSNKEMKERIFKLIDRCAYPPPPEFLQPSKAIRDVAQSVYKRWIDKDD